MKTVIIEDIPYETALIKSLLANQFPQIQIVGLADNVELGVELIQSQTPDFVLMDIEIMGGTSYDILATLQKRNIPFNFEIIFMTGNRRYDYATMAFAYSALDFLTKPIDPIAFEKAVNKAIQRANPQQYKSQIELFMDFIRSADNQSSKLAINKVGGVVEFINIVDILYLEADREITTFYLKDNTKLKSVKNLGYYDQLLVSNHHFFSISNSLLINLDELKSYKHKIQEVILNNGTVLYASRRGGKDLKGYIDENPNLNKSKSLSFQSIFKRLFG